MPTPQKEPVLYTSINRLPATIPPPVQIVNNASVVSPSITTPINSPQINRLPATIPPVQIVNNASVVSPSITTPINSPQINRLPATIPPVQIVNNASVISPSITTPINSLKNIKKKHKKNLTANHQPQVGIGSKTKQFSSKKKKRKEQKNFHVIINKVGNAILTKKQIKEYKKNGYSVVIK